MTEYSGSKEDVSSLPVLRAGWDLQWLRLSFPKERGFS